MGKNFLLCRSNMFSGVEHRLFFPVKSMKTRFPLWSIANKARKTGIEWSFIEGSKVALCTQIGRICSNSKGFFVPSALVSSQIASTAFTWGTVAVLPFYTLMVFAPRVSLTKRLMESNVPYGVLGILYGYLLYISWTPETLRLPGMTKLFSNEMTMASAWIHLLAVDLYAARQVFHDGMKTNVETRHSVSLCLLFCPIGILTHVITKVLVDIRDT